MNAKRGRGFGNERHGKLKVAVTAGALIGFGGAWFGFTSTHSSDTAAQADTVVAPPTATPTIAPVRTGASHVQPTPTPTVRPAATQPATRVRRSRGS
jgi:hypothetical protein